MESNIDKYKSDLKSLINKGDYLLEAIKHECNPVEYEAMLRKSHEEEIVKEFFKKMPSFHGSYQDWYSESYVLIKQILPDRLQDFIKYYEKPKNRKAVTYESYRIEDYLQGLVNKRYGGVVIVGPDAAVPCFTQQLNILKSVERKFESSLFEIKQLVQADLFDSELDAAKALLKHKFGRAAGAMAGVVLERHLHQVCENHNIVIKKKNSTINDLNELLKENEVIEVPQWRFIQHLGDLRNLCDHEKKKEPTEEQITDLIDGVGKITKTLF